VPENALKAAGRRPRWVRWLAILGLLSLSYVLGALVMYFDLPTADFLDRAFLGGRAWFERQKAFAPLPDKLQPALSIDVDKPEKTFDGFTAVTTERGTEVTLINMRGDVVHKWTAPFRAVWPEPPHIAQPVHESRIGFFGTHLYANGDLLAVYHGGGDTPYGYGLVKLDKDSKVIWRYAANVHHTVDVSKDGTIYALTHKLINEMPKGLEFIRPPCLLDYLVVLSAKGEELKKVPILEAFWNSPYSILLAGAGTELKRGRGSTGPARVVPRMADVFGDALHTNCLMVLTPELAPRFPLFKAGQVLISVRALDIIAVLDIESQTVVWAAQGSWRGQHAPQFLDNGRLLIFDNVGSWLGSRVLEYDPQTQAYPWSYQHEDSEPFLTFQFGMSQRLPNGNTLIVNSGPESSLLEVTPAREVVWSCSFGFQVYVPTALRYSPAQLKFLKGGERVRP
jgi:hypothetical protein